MLDVPLAQTGAIVSVALSNDEGKLEYLYNFFIFVIEFILNKFLLDYPASNVIDGYNLFNSFYYYMFKINYKCIITEMIIHFG